eukprot:TRINITY_DN7518_c0_g1_i1.p1 TRINITY_DN7518_c0_g1~~TRINITY_DN7518_c0_g1_i1.p1  ORF type:complete len:463 (+),score=200.59 TRINITY_DN7518_c0_g1_i1:53-1441(+)
MITRVGRRALNKVGARYVSGFKSRTTVSQRGSGLTKADALSSGLRSGICDVGSLIRVWPKQELNAVDAAKLVGTYDSIISKGVKTTAAAVGKARALLSLGQFDAARSAISSASGASGTTEHAAVLACKADIAATAYYYYAHIVKAADPNFVTPNVAGYAQEATECFNELTQLLPDDWSIALAYGEYLLAKGDKAATPMLKEALKNANKEVTSKRGKNESYISNVDSAVALADYVDYKYQNSYKSPLGGILGEASQRSDKLMEEKLAAAYPGLTEEELLAITSIEAAIDVGAFDFTRKPDVELMNIKPWEGKGAQATRYLMEKYTGGKLGVAQRSVGLSAEEELAMVQGNAEMAADLENVVGLQKQLSTALAEQVRDGCKVKYAEALLADGEFAVAEKLCTEVLFDNSYVDMYYALQIRGKARHQLGKIDGSDKDFKAAFALENSFADADIPSMDRNAYRNEF